MAERKVWIEGDIDRLIEKLKAEPAMWETYIEGEIQHNQIQSDIHQWIRVTLHALFPNVSYDEHTDLVILFRNFVRKQLGLH